MVKRESSDKSSKFISDLLHWGEIRRAYVWFDGEAFPTRVADVQTFSDKTIGPINWAFYEYDARPEGPL